MSSRSRANPVLVLLLAAAPLLAGAADPASSSSADALSSTAIEQQLKSAGFPQPAGRGLHRMPDTSCAVTLNIAFEYNSSRLKPQASAQLQQLELALVSDALREYRFLVAGHTDAKGNAQSNQRLSTQRAEAVKGFLTAHGVDAARLDAVGYGSERLLVPDQPDDPRNRRVQICKLGAAR
jgi:outer membrane protein OmpA-like peptidoglycan-associated protein